MVRPRYEVLRNVGRMITFGSGTCKPSGIVFMKLPIIFQYLLRRPILVS